MSVYRYSPEEVSLTIAGHRVVGWDRIEIKRNSATFREIKGIGGKNTRVRSLDTSATLVVSIMQTSPSNNVLTDIHLKDSIYGTGRLEVTLKGGSGETLITSVEGYVAGYTDAIYTDNIEYRPWVINLQSTDDFFINGNAAPDESFIQEVLERFNLI